MKNIIKFMGSNGKISKIEYEVAISTNNTNNATIGLFGWPMTTNPVTNPVAKDVTKYRRTTHHPDGSSRQIDASQEAVWQKYFKIGSMTDSQQWQTVEDVIERITGYCKSFGGYPPSVEEVTDALNELANAKLVEKESKTQW